MLGLGEEKTRSAATMPISPRRERTSSRSAIYAFSQHANIIPIVRYVHPDEFAEYKVLGEQMGFKPSKQVPWSFFLHAFDQAESVVR